MIRHETDADLINRIANSDAVRPFIHATGESMDFSPAVGRPTQTGVVFLSNGEDAVAAFEATAEGIYQSHTMFAETCRGRRAIDTAREMVAWMFAHNARIVWGCTPRANRAARWFNRQIGAQVIGGDEQDELFEIRREAYA